MWDVIYAPFGGVSYIWSNPANIDLRFPGQWFQLESSLAYNWHRHYDATLGRYVQPDPIGFAGGRSLYGYAGQSPLANADFMGLAIGDFPPPPPGYGPGWITGKFNNGKWFLTDPEGNKWLLHAEDRDHWRHWDKDDGTRWPPNSKKGWPLQKKLKADQCEVDPNGDAAPWEEPADFFVVPSEIYLPRIFPRGISQPRFSPWIRVPVIP